MAPRLRPRFEVEVARAPQQVLRGLEAALADPDGPCRGRIVGRHALLHVREDLRHTWSPYLDLEVEPWGEGALLRGRFGPHPSIWSFFAALYAICAFVALGGLVVGLSQLSLGFPAWGLWAVPGALVLAAVVYVVALTGQRLAQAQMHALRDVVHRAAGLAESAAPAQSSPDTAART